MRAEEGLVAYRGRGGRSHHLEQRQGTHGFRIDRRGGTGPRSQSGAGRGLHVNASAPPDGGVSGRAGHRERSGRVSRMRW